MIVFPIVTIRNLWSLKHLYDDNDTGQLEAISISVSTRAVW
jgi:hypothetical protein